MIYRCCAVSRRSEVVTEFRLGCRRAQYCVLYVSTRSGWTRVETRRELGKVLGPARSPAEALGRAALVALGDDLLLDGALSGSRQPDPDHPTIEFEAVRVNPSAGGFDVRLSSASHCGAIPTIYAQTYFVNEDGLTSPLGNELLLRGEPREAIFD
jgi:hypothetical protein